MNYRINEKSKYSIQKYPFNCIFYFMQFSMHENISTRLNLLDFDLIHVYLYEYNRVPNKFHPYDTNQSSVHRLCHIYFKLKRFHIRYAKTHRLHEKFFRWFSYHSIKFSFEFREERTIDSV